MSAYALPGFFPPLDSNDTFDKCKASQNDCTSKPQCLPSSAVRVHVKEARVNSVKLINSLTKQAESVKQMSRFRKWRRSYCSAANSGRPHEDCIEFELTVRVGGRCYDLVKTIKCFQYLQQELEEEVEDRHLFQEQVIDIPPLPPLQEHQSLSFTAEGGGMGPGFMLLNTILQSYKPNLEKWMEKVLSLLSLEESASLTHFLREPLWEPKLEKHFQQNSMKKLQPAELHAIEELSNDGFDEDDF